MITIALTVLAIARVTRLVTSDVLFAAPRRWVVSTIAGTAREGEWRSTLAYLFVCDWCASMYVGAAGAGAWAAWGDTMWFQGVTLALAASYVTGWLATTTDRGE